MKRIFACLFIVAVLPLITSSTRDLSVHSGPCTTVAYAGHTVGTGYYCPCDAGPDGLCPCCGTNFNNRLTADEPSDDAAIQAKPSINAAANSESESGSAGVLLFLVALLVWGTIGT